MPTPLPSAPEEKTGSATFSRGVAVPATGAVRVRVGSASGALVGAAGACGLPSTASSLTPKKKVRAKAIKTARTTPKAHRGKFGVSR